ncbi:murein L,D-transpeptidase catalytic domain-containing protein [Flavobacterium sp.]|uniref:murein L,D-transpeptidase catalytic domain-containing protein n=1 Tax=Flavobacterium sp. TaxID=239 RepID=UPI0025B7F2FF|nr:murein L,D-transpeptidase catalytic domain family protein [Flavobacterium sp.]
MRRIIFVLTSMGILFFSIKILSKNTKINPPIVSVSDDLTEEKLLNRAVIIKKFIANNPSYNKEIVFFIDMKISSGKNRFFVYNLKNDAIIDQGLVAHGIGSETHTEGVLMFSNEPNSFCTSLGKYYIGHSYIGKFGKSYKLYGLEKTNNNAFTRNIVIHKYDKVPCEEQDKPICKSLGCPMLNEEFYARIEKLIDNSRSKILLDIYY